MKVEIMKYKQLAINMSDQIRELINGFTEFINRKVMTPSSITLMDVNTNAEKLLRQKLEKQFYSTTNQVSI